MSIFVVAVAGHLKGRVWPIDGAELIVGRDSDCHIVVCDPMSSRHHCRFFLEGETVRLEDLGSQNPPLVNGNPVKTIVLFAGDEIAIGHNLFLVTAIGGNGSEDPAKSHNTATVPWDRSAPVFLNAISARPDLRLRPHTVLDLAFLYETACELSGLGQVDEILDALRLRLVERFKPLRLWVAFLHGKEDLAFWSLAHPASVAPPELPVEAIRCVLKQGQGGLFPSVRPDKGRPVHTLKAVAPLIAGGVFIGALVIETETPHGTYDEEDLKLLVLLANSVAPIIHSAGLMEQLESDNEHLRAITGHSLTLVGNSRAMQHVRAQIAKAARSNLNVLITGETGTGKELAARMVHARSAVRAEPFVIVNCAAIPRDLFESEFFGYEKNAFTGAGQTSPGLFSRAHGGTLFLDEVGDLSPENQAKILRAVESGSFRRVGGSGEQNVTVRIIAATNKDLEQAIQKGVFREDLYHRLSGFGIHIPPLHEHASDVPSLVEHFLQLAAGQAKHPVTGITADTLQQLKSRAWPGNVRELRNCILRAAMTARRGTLTLADFPDLPKSFIEASPAGGELPLSLAELEKRHIKAVIDQCAGNMKAAAQVLQIARSTLYLKIAEHNIR